MSRIGPGQRRRRRVTRWKWLIRGRLLKAGFVAGAAGQPASANPHIPHDWRQGAQWHTGWRMGRQARRGSAVRLVVYKGEMYAERRAA